MSEIYKTFTSESVTQGHPDKVADIISDAILDAYMKEDPEAHVACETCVTTDFCMVFGEVNSDVKLSKADIEKIIRETIIEIGYDNPDLKFSGYSCNILNKLHEQSLDIKQGVDREDETGAGDQGLMFGFATNETESLMPYPISLARNLTNKLTELRESGEIPYLRPDGKSQVSVNYNEEGKVDSLAAIVISTQHDETMSDKQDELKNDIYEKLIKKVVPEEFLTKNTPNIHINPTGKFEIGGPDGDAGLTGRKIIVDTYGGYAPHGGGAFSGKDCTKVDRSACYMARYIAKNIVASGLAEKCLIQLSYAIGVPEPTSVLVNTFGTEVDKNLNFEQIVCENFKLTPDGIIETLGLRDISYKKTAKYGHFGIESLPWEETDKIDVLKKYIK